MPTAPHQTPAVVMVAALSETLDKAAQLVDEQARVIARLRAENARLRSLVPYPPEEA